MNTVQRASAAQVHVDSALSDFATAYSSGELFADMLSPIKGVSKRSAKFFTYSRRDTEKRVNDRLSTEGGANEISYSQGTSNYSVEDRGLNGIVPSEVESNADAPLSPEEDTTQDVTAALMREREIRVATLLTTQANFASGNYATAGAYWSDKVSGTPLDDINTGHAALPPTDNAKTYLVMSRPVWNALRVHPDMLGLRGGGGVDRGQVSRREAAESLEVDEILVSNAWYDTANAGQTVSRARIWSGTKAVLVRVPASVSGNRVHSFSVTFRENPGLVVRKWEDPDRGKGGSLVVRVEFSDDEVIVQDDAAYLIQGVLA